MVTSFVNKTPALKWSGTILYPVARIAFAVYKTGHVYESIITQISIADMEYGAKAWNSISIDGSSYLGGQLREEGRLKLMVGLGGGVLFARPEYRCIGPSVLARSSRGRHYVY
jgi:hypothetical protein